MNKRLQQFINAENISQSQFAERIGVAKASVSHILAGRNKPGYEFLESMARQFPTLNLEWLIAGRGRMYKNTAGEAEIPQAVTLEEPRISEPQSGNLFEVGTESADSQPDRPRISRIVVFYDNGTFTELR